MNTTILKKNQEQELSIEFCDNFVRRLNPEQSLETKMLAVLALRNLIKNTGIRNSILYNFLVDSISSKEKELRIFVEKTIKEIANNEIIELLNMKLNEVNDKQIKAEIKQLIKKLQK